MPPGAIPPRDPKAEPRPPAVTVVVAGVPPSSAARPPQAKPGAVGVPVAGAVSPNKAGFEE